MAASADASTSDGTEWVVYFDDDCTALAGWVAAFTRTIEQHPDVSFVVGNVEGTNRGQDSITVSLFSADREQLISGRWIRPRHIGYGVNFAARRSIIEELGGWD